MAEVNTITVGDTVRVDMGGEVVGLEDERTLLVRFHNTNPPGKVSRIPIEVVTRMNDAGPQHAAGNASGESATS